MISTKYLKKILFYSAVALGGVSLLCGVGWGAIFFEILLVYIECAATGCLVASAATAVAATGCLVASAATAVAATGVAIGNSTIQDP